MQETVSDDGNFQPSSSAVSASDAEDFPQSFAAGDNDDEALIAV